MHHAYLRSHTSCGRWRSGPGSEGCANCEDRIYANARAFVLHLAPLSLPMFLTQQIDFVSSLSLYFPIPRKEGGKRRGREKEGIEVENLEGRGEERKDGAARNEEECTRPCKIHLRASTIEYSSKSCAGRNGESARNGKESAGLNKTTLLNYLLGRGEQSRYRDASSTSSIYQ